MDIAKLDTTDPEVGLDMPDGAVSRRRRVRRRHRKAVEVDAETRNRIRPSSRRQASDRIDKCVCIVKQATGS